LTTPDNSFDIFESGPTISDDFQKVARKWRVAVLSDRGIASFGIAELSWFTKRARIDFATALTSFTTSDGSDFRNAIDGDRSTVAYIGADSSGDTGIWIELEFKSEVDASKVTLDTDSLLEHCVAIAAVQYWNYNEQAWRDSSYLKGLNQPSSRVFSYGKVLGFIDKS